MGGADTMATLLVAPLRKRAEQARLAGVDAEAFADALDGHIRQRDPQVRAYVEWRPSAGSRPSMAFAPTVTYKDLIDVAGFTTRYGSICGLRHYPTRSAPVAVRLAMAGTRCLGKVESAEFGLGVTVHCRNPRYPNYSTSGSSSGSAVAVAAALCDFSIATDTLASARYPAANCGVVGLRLTHRPAAFHGILSLSPSLDALGVLTRTCDDLLAVLQRTRLSRTPGETPARVRLRTGQDWLAEPHDSAVRHAWDWLVDRFTAAQVSTEPVHLPGWPGHRTAWRLMTYEAAQTLQDLTRAADVWFSAPVQAVLDEGCGITGPEYKDLCRRQAAYAVGLAAMFTHDPSPVLLPLDTAAPRRIAELPYRRAGALTFKDEGDPGLGSVASLAGLPALAVPVRTGADAPPLAFQLIGARHSEGQLAAIGAVLERLLG